MLLTYLINSALVGMAVVIHYETLNCLSLIIPKIKLKHRAKVMIGIFGAFLGHICEVWLFAIGYYEQLHTNLFGSLEGAFDKSLLDCVYFSFTTYTSVGFGEIRPTGDIRFLAGLEALTGLMLIAWTSSFMFLEMQKLWQKN